MVAHMCRGHATSRGDCSTVARVTARPNIVGESSCAGPREAVPTKPSWWGRGEFQLPGERITLVGKTFFSLSLSFSWMKMWLSEKKLIFPPIFCQTESSLVLPPSPLPLSDKRFDNCNFCAFQHVREYTILEAVASSE